MGSIYAGKKILISGAASGIGAALAQRLAAESAILILWDIDQTKLDDLCDKLCRTQGVHRENLYTVNADVSDFSASSRAWLQLPEAIRSIDFLFANAGITGVSKADPFDHELNHRIMSVNYFGTVHLIALALPEMLRRESGHIIATSSLAGVRALPGSACYSASKAAQKAFIEGLRINLRGSGVKASVVMPGFVDTPINSHLLHENRLPFVISAERAARHILSRVERGKALISFPRIPRFLSRLSLIIPARVYDFVVTFHPFKKKERQLAQ